MPAPTTIDEFLELARKSGVVDEKRFDGYMNRMRESLPEELGKVAGVLIRDGVLTQFQAEQLLLGRWRRFSIGKYKVLERIGSGGMGQVYLCEHKYMRRRVALKVLPGAKARDSSALERFYREARAVAALDHPNIVRAYDIDHEDQLHFLVMEYIDGASLQDIVKRHGPLEIPRAANYIRQAAAGLQHAHQMAGLVHRDIKPGNILVDRQGTVKVLDLGLARFFHDEDELITRKYDENVLGTADYLAPEQALDSHSVDIRADIYSLGGTFYFCLTGTSPFNEGTVAQKLIWHQTRQPRLVRQVRAEVPEELEEIVEKMMAKDAAKRYQTPAEVVNALEPWTRGSIAKPAENEMPRLSPAAMGTSIVPDVHITNAEEPSAPLTAREPGPAAAAAALSETSRDPAAAAAAANTLQDEGLSRLAQSATLSEPSRDEDQLGVSWESLMLDTDNATARGDTIGRHARKSGGPTPIGTRHRPWSWIAGAGIALAVVLGIIYAVARRGSQPSGTGTTPPDGRAPVTWTVSKSGQDNCLKAVQDALDRARDGDRIVVLDESLEEPILLGGRQWKEAVTLEAADPAKPVRWKSPGKFKISKLIDLAHVGNLRLRGFVFDGQGLVQDLIALSGSCAGLVLEDVQLEGFTRAGITFWNCSGTDAAPIVLERVRILASKEADWALGFHARPTIQPASNQFIKISDCRFEGSFRAAVEIASPTSQVEFRGNRFFQSNDAFRYELAQPIQMKVLGNTFADIRKTAFDLLQLPPAGGSNALTVQNNLFLRTARLASVEAAPVERAAALLAASGNVRDSASAEGTANLHAAVRELRLPIDPDDDAKFLRYLKLDPLARAGMNGQPVGAPPLP